ncbi:MAG: alpha-2-macroglobulin, partial [Oceanotoga sp.]
MKKKILSILLILLSLISFSYVYTSGNNVISKGDSISIYGYDEKNVMMNVYQITNPEEFYVENKSLIELKKEFKYSRYIKLDQSGNIEDKEKFNDYGLFVIEFK